jgi:hypothetical protein
MLLLLFSLLVGPAFSAGSLEVSILTTSGPKVLRSWGGEDLKKISKGGMVSAQDLIFEKSTQNLDLNDKADVDLATIYGPGGRISRVPRFMIWRGSLRFRLEKDGSLSSVASSAPGMVPADFFKVRGIERIELSRASVLYPGTRLSVRTNPAASRGEKIFTQGCMACHSLTQTPKIEATLLNEVYLRQFATKHQPTQGYSLDSRALRGLLAYREALASEKNSVKSPK